MPFSFDQLPGVYQNLRPLMLADLGWDRLVLMLEEVQSMRKPVGSAAVKLQLNFSKIVAGLADRPGPLRLSHTRALVRRGETS